MKCYVFSSVVRTVMSISLENPGFLLDVSDQVDIHRPDASSIASGSSSSGESTLRSCPRCHGRMSSISLDKHVFCVKCRGSECDHNFRCDDCLKWSKEDMDSYVKLCKSLKAKSRPSKPSSRSSSSPPRITAPDIDFDAILTTQLDSVHKSVDKKLVSLSDSLMSNMSLMFDKLRSELVHTSVVGDPAVYRQSVSHTEPPFPPRPTSTKRHKSLRGLGEGVTTVPQGSGLAHHRVDSRSQAGNERADQAAKEAMRMLYPSLLSVPYSDFRSAIHFYIKDKWQASWSSLTDNLKLKSIHPSIEKWQSLGIIDRRTSILLTRMRIGHTHATHSYLMKSGDERQAPLCNSCRVGLTIEHILTACPAFDSERRAASLHGRSMSEVLGNDCSIGGLMLFLRNTGFYHKF